MTTLPTEYTPQWAPIYPRDSVYGTRRTSPVAWICPAGHRHARRDDTCTPASGSPRCGSQGAA